MKKIKFVLGSLAVVAMLATVSCNKDEDTDGGDGGNTPPTTKSELVVNELMTKVVSQGIVYTDAEGKYSDWVEFYNNGDADINIAGYFVGDDGKDGDVADYYEIPTGHDAITTIAAKGRLVVVFGASSDAAGTIDMEGVVNDTLFIPMSLSAKKDIAVAIFDTDKAFVTESADFSASGDFGKLEDDKSLGRVADGADTWQVWDVPTPGAENK